MSEMPRVEMAEASAPERPRRIRKDQLLRPDVLIGASIVTVLVVCGVSADHLTPYDPTKLMPEDRLLPPAWEAGGSSEHLLGTDQLGRDVLSRLIAGARNSLMIAGWAVLLATIFGSAVGLVAGYHRGWIDTVLMRITDVQLAFPFILLAIAILAITTERTPGRVIAVLALADWVVHARITRSRVIVERERDYVRAARALGASDTRVMTRYILPMVVPTIAVIAMLEFAALLLAEASLSFIGLGIDLPQVSWGTIMADGFENIAVAWWLLFFPGLAMFVAILGVNLLADGLADVLDPRLKITGRFAPRRARRDSGQPEAPMHAGVLDAGVADTAAEEVLLAVSGLEVEFPREQGGSVRAVRGVSFSVRPGERVGIVGESGSGKSVTALAVLGLLDAPGRIAAGEILLGGVDLTSFGEQQLRGVRGRDVAMIFQDPSSALNPVIRVDRQVAEIHRLHRGLDRKQARAAAVESLRTVQISDPERVARSYPFELSGGMQQRVMIAMALSCRPQLLIADEPTTALDVTTQAAILGELDALTLDLQTAVLLISHDVGVVAEFTGWTIVMYAGQVCEDGPTDQVIHAPRHPYTQALVKAADAEVEVDSEEIAGTSPSANAATVGCPYSNICPHVMPACRVENPALRLVAERTTVACHLYGPSE